MADTFLLFPTSDATARFTVAMPAQKPAPKTITPTRHRMLFPLVPWMVVLAILVSNEEMRITTNDTYRMDC